MKIRTVFRFYKILQALRKEASDVAANPSRTNQLITKAEAKNNKFQNSLNGLFHQVNLLIRMIRAWRSGIYPIPLRTIIFSIAGLIYFLNPIDIIPDFLFPIGFADDAALIALAFKNIRKDLKKFYEWEKRQPVNININ